MIPRTKIKIVECRLNDVSLIIMGKPIIKVRMFPSKMESEGLLSFCLRNEMVNAAKDIPDNIARAFPKYPSKLRSSRKNNARPPSIMNIVNQSIRVDFSRKVNPN